MAVAVGPRGELTLDLEPVSSVDGLISQLIGIVMQAQIEDRWQRLKICASDECRWSFYDGSRNRGGTWCKMETCGNVIKNRAYRARRSTSAERAGPVQATLKRSRARSKRSIEPVPRASAGVRQPERSGVAPSSEISRPASPSIRAVVR